jgi:hypothetical protein
MLGRVFLLFDQKERCRQPQARRSIGTTLAVCPMRFAVVVLEKRHEMWQNALKHQSVRAGRVEKRGKLLSVVKNPE